MTGGKVSPRVMVDALNREFPSYSAAYVGYADRQRYVLVTTDDSDPWCLISADPDEIRAAINGVPGA